MCKAFSCVIGRDKTVTWRFGTDSHEDLIKIAGYKDDTLDPEKIEFCRIEISPKNGSYLEPDEWVFRVDMDVTPAWWTLAHKRACEREHKKWIKELDKVLVRKPIIHPFQITPPEKITEEHTQLVREWDSVWASVRASVGASVWASVGDSVWASVWDSAWDSVWASVWASVGASVWDSVWASAWAYAGTFFNIPRSGWTYTKNIPEGYPFQPDVTLWEMGLVASFDGKTWRLHGGPDGRVLWEGVGRGMV
jgi:hypothetical protein